MKLNISEQPLQVALSDDMEELEFGIKSCDVGFIIQLLRKDMYKYPIDAICREIASNSRDANREVGLGDKPIEIIINNSAYLTSEHAISFKDNGPGISPDRMKDVFLNYGASTKRDTDDQTGGFGLGAKTPFAYTNTFCIETFYDNKAYVYVAVVKGGNKGRMYLLSEYDDFENKVTIITIPIKEGDIADFEMASYRATYFWDVQPVYINFSKIRQPNCYSKILDCDKFSLVFEEERDRPIPFSKNSRVIALLDGIPYEIDNTVRGVRGINSILESRHTRGFFIIKVSFSEVDISPNRETLQYNQKTIDNLGALFIEAANIMCKDNASLMKRLSTTMEKIVFLKFLERGFPHNAPIHEHKPFNMFSKEELVSIFISRKISDKLDIPSNLGEAFKLSTNFRGNFPGLGLYRINFESTRSNKAGIRCSCQASDINMLFFKSDVYLLDTPKRNTYRERYYWETYKRSMLVIKPSDLYFKYDSLTQENKDENKGVYEKIKGSIGSLNKAGIQYKLYSSLSKLKPSRSAPAVKKGLNVRILDVYNEHVSPLEIVSWDNETFTSRCNRVFEKEDYLFLRVSDLRRSKRVLSSSQVLLYIFYSRLFSKNPHKMILAKNYDPMSNGIKSLDTFMDDIPKQEKSLLGSFFIYKDTDLEDLSDGLNFKTDKYKKAAEEYIEVIKKLKLMRYRVSSIGISEEVKKYYKTFSDLDDAIKIVEEINVKFPFLRFSEGMKKEMVQTYIDAMERYYIEKGEL